MVAEGQGDVVTAAAFGAVGRRLREYDRRDWRTQPGERVITTGASMVKDGDQVQIIP